LRHTTLVWLISVVALSLILTSLSRAGTLAPVESTVNRVFSPLQDVLHTAFGPATDFFANLGDYNEVRDENDALREENERLQAELARLRSAQADSKELSDLEKVQKERTEFQFLLAGVVGTDPNVQRDVVAIDRGSDDGVEVGMVIVGQGGSLIGRVTKVLADASWVTLINDTHSSVNAEIQESGARGVVSGQPDGSLSMDLVKEESNIQVGDRVLTSGLGGNFPKGLYIGIVSSAQSTPQDLFVNISVEPAVRLSRLDQVLVITNFHPINLDEGGS
jgi:rod shape-determining protein MreC